MLLPEREDQLITWSMSHRKQKTARTKFVQKLLVGLCKTS